MKRIALFYYLTAALALTTQSDAADEPDLLRAVNLALNGTLNPDHIGPDETQRLEKLIAKNAAQANKIVLGVIEQPGNKGRLGNLYVINVANLTVDGDKPGVSEVLRRYVQLIDSAVTEARTKKPNDDGQNDDNRRRTEKLRRARLQAEAFEAKWVK